MNAKRVTLNTYYPVWLRILCDYFRMKGYETVPSMSSVISIVAMKEGGPLYLVHANMLGHLREPVVESLASFARRLPSARVVVAVPEAVVDNETRKVIINLKRNKFYRFHPEKDTYSPAYRMRMRGYKVSVET